LDEQVAIKNKQLRGWDYEACDITQISPDYFEQNYPHVDLLNIDIEGVDSDVILNFDFKKWSPTVVLFEDNQHFGGDQKIKNHLNKNGYAILFMSGGTTGYYLKSAII